MNVASNVWERRGIDTISDRDFYSLYMAFTFGGLALTAMVAGWVMPLVEIVPGADDKSSIIWHGSIPMLPLFIGAFIAAIAGTVIALASTNWVISLIGYALVAGPFGLLLGPTVALYTEASVVKAALVTASLTAALGIGGFLYPKSLESWGPMLFIALLGLVAGQFAVLIAGYFFGAEIGGWLTILDWIGVFIFSAYIIYDVNRAKFVPRTIDNAVDCALALYLDIINLFIRILQIMGKRK